VDKRTNLTKDESIELAERVNIVAKKWTNRERFLFQIQQDKLCMDFSLFHKATEEALGRSVWTHEFAKPEELLREFLGLVKKADMRRIFEKVTEIRKHKSAQIRSKSGQAAKEKE